MINRRYVASADREQVQLAPLSLDDMVDENNPCRVIDEFCNILNMKELGFKYAETLDLGRQPFDPRELLKLYLYESHKIFYKNILCDS